MKSNKIYFVKFTKSVDVDGDDFTHPIYSDLSSALDKEEAKYLGFTNDDDIFIRLVDYKVKSVLDIFSKYGFEFKVFDVTSKVISGDIQKIYPEVQELTPYIFDDFRLENTKKDDVLDKILERGINSLDDLDKRILSE